MDLQSKSLPQRRPRLIPSDPRLKALGLLLPCALALALAFHLSTPETASSELMGHHQSRSSDDLIQPIEVPQGLDPEKIELGKKLFNDPMLSHSSTLSCASCHAMNSGGAEHTTHSAGTGGKASAVNAPTVLNAGLNFSQFWDGRATTLEQQVDAAVKAPAGLSSNWEEIEGRLKGSPEYVQAFQAIYNGEITRQGIEDAIAEYERSLVTPNSRFDRFLNHEENVLTQKERTGYQLFVSLGCASCHQGMNLGGNMYQKLGVMAPYFEDRGNITAADRGRFNVTGDAQDLYMFKVPSLRNVALTAPYFHDGSAATLNDAVRMMGKYQLGRKLTAEEVDLLVEFLKTLTGELDGKPL